MITENMRNTNGTGVSANRNVKKVLVLEPHIDDLELGLSIWLKKNSFTPLEIYLVTFCNGRNDDSNNLDRANKRKENLEFFKKEYPNIKFHTWNFGLSDTTLEDYSIGYLLDKFYKLLDKEIIPLVGNFSFFKEIYFSQADLHPDHEIVNKIGKILTRTFKGRVFEYIIRSSNYSNEHIYNSEIKTEFNFNDDTSKRFIECCMYPGEKIYFQKVLHTQKNFDGKYISDRLNLIKDVFIASDRI